MDVCSQRHAFIFMARDGLNGLQVYAFAVQGGQIRVPADVGRHAVYVDGALDPLPCALVRLFGVGLALAVDDKTFFAAWFEEFQQAGRKRYTSYARFRLCIADDRFVFAKRDSPANVDDPFIGGNILPPQAVYLAAESTRPCKMGFV